MAAAGPSPPPGVWLEAAMLAYPPQTWPREGPFSWNRHPQGMFSSVEVSKCGI